MKEFLDALAIVQAHAVNSLTGDDAIDMRTNAGKKEFRTVWAACETVEKYRLALKEFHGATLRAIKGFESSRLENPIDPS